MIVNPRPGQRVLIWYRAELRSFPFHGQRGTVIQPGKGKPRNHLIDVAGVLVVVPCGNLRSEQR